MLLLLLMLSTAIGGCGTSGAVRLDNPPMPIPGPRQAVPMVNHQTGEVGVWESVGSAANGVRYTLELEMKAKQDDVLMNAHNKISGHRTPVRPVEVAQPLPKRSDGLQKASQLPADKPKSYQETVGQGEGGIHIARRAIRRCLDDRDGESLSPAQMTYAEDCLVKRTDGMDNLQPGELVIWGRQDIMGAVISARQEIE